LSVQQRRYNAKLLLFGEYSILHGSKAFSFPINSFYAYWAKKSVSDEALVSFTQHAVSQLGELLDVERLEADIKQGCYIHSTIPFGYGLGSSGTVVAAYLDRYAISSDITLHSLRNQMSQLESFFHGRSSGTDPLISYLNYPLVFHDQDNIELISRRLSLDGLHFYLLDSGQPRQTKNLVNDYLQRFKSDQGFKEAMQDITTCNDEIIARALIPTATDLMQQIKYLSKLQYDHMQEMILENIQIHWQESLTDNTYAIKLCGAGGGGFYLVISQEVLALDKFEHLEMIKISL